MKYSKQSLGIAICIIATVIFAFQDGLTKHLSNQLPISQFVMIRYWIFFIFVLFFVHRREGIIAAVKSKKPVWQVTRGALLVLEVMLFAFGLRYLSLADMHGLFVLYPIFVTLLATPILKETITLPMLIWALLGFLGALLIIRPGMGVFGLESIIPITCAFMFALYTVLSRYVSHHARYSSNVFFVAFIGLLISSFWGGFEWQPLSKELLLYCSLLAVSGLISHMLLMKSLEYAKASVLQPFFYFTLLWAVIFSWLIYSETPSFVSVIGMAIIVLSGISMMLSERKANKKANQKTSQKVKE